MADLFSPTLGNAGEVFFQPPNPVQDQTSAQAVGMLNDLATTFFRTAANTQSTETESAFQRRARAEFTLKLQKAQATGDPTRVRALILEGSSIFGDDQWYKATVQQFTGLDPATNINPTTALVAKYQEYMKDRPWMAIATQVKDKETGQIDPVASLENAMSLINAEAANQYIIDKNRQSDLNSWLTTVKPRVDLVVQTKVAQMGQLIKNVQDQGPFSLAQITDLRTQWASEKAIITSSIPAGLPDEEKKQITGSLDAIDNFFNAMQSDEKIFESAVNANKSKAFLTFVESLSDPSLKAMALIYGTDQFKDFADIVSLNTLATPEKTQAVFKALETAAQNYNLFRPLNPGSINPNTPNTPDYLSMSPEEILSDKALADNMALPAAKKFTTAQANADALATYTDEMFSRPSAIQAGVAFAANAFTQLYTKDGFNYAPKLQTVFTGAFLKNVDRLMKESPEDAPALYALMIQAVGKERVRHRTEIQSLQAAGNIIVDPDTGKMSIDTSKLPTVTEDRMNQIIERLRMAPGRGEESVIKFKQAMANLSTGKLDLDQWLKDNPPGLSDRLFEALGFGTSLQTEVELLRKHLDTINYLNNLEGMLPKPAETPSSTLATNPVDFSTNVLETGKALLPLIDQTESGGNYNAYFGNAQQNDVKFTNMTIDEVLNYQQNNRVKLPDGRTTTAVGRYQIVSTTLQSLKDELGLTGQEKFDQAMQDRMYLTLVKRRINSGVTGFRNEWEGLKSVSDSRLRSIIGG